MAKPRRHRQLVGDSHLHHRGLPVARALPLSYMPPPIPRHGYPVLVPLSSQVVSAFPASTGRSARASPFSRLAQRSLTLQPVRSPSHLVPLHRRLQPLRYLHDCSDCYRLERKSPGGFRTHWKSAALARRTSNSGCQIGRTESLLAAFNDF